MAFKGLSFCETFEGPNRTYSLVTRFDQKFLSYIQCLSVENINGILFSSFLHDITHALLTEFSMYNNAIAFSISIYKYLVHLVRLLNIGTCVSGNGNGNNCRKKKRERETVERIRGMQRAPATLLKYAFLSFRFAIRVVDWRSIRIQTYRKEKPSRRRINWIKKKSH